MVDSDESLKIFQQFRMNNGDSSTGQENEVVDIEKTRTAAGEGSVENERHAGLRDGVIKDDLGFRWTLVASGVFGSFFGKHGHLLSFKGLFWRVEPTKAMNFVILSWSMGRFYMTWNYPHDTGKFFRSTPCDL